MRRHFFFFLNISKIYPTVPSHVSAVYTLNMWTLNIKMENLSICKNKTKKTTFTVMGDGALHQHDSSSLW